MPVQSQNQPQQNQYPVPFDPDDMELEMDMPQSQSSSGSQPISNGSSPASISSLDAATPPDTPVSTPLSTYASPMVYPSPKPFLQPQPQIITQLQQSSNSPYSSPYNSPYTSQPPSPHSYHPMSAGPIAAFETTTLVRRPSPNSLTPPTASSNTAASSILNPAPNRPNLNLNLTSFSRPSSTTPHHRLPVEPFNPYARYVADYSVDMPGANLEGDGVIAGMDGFNNNVGNPNAAKHGMGDCFPPALLFSNAGTPESTPESSRVPSPTQAKPNPPTLNVPIDPPAAIPAPALAPVVTPPVPNVATATSRLSTSIGRPATASLLLSKPFKCPKPNCNKSYKQANGKVISPSIQDNKAENSDRTQISHDAREL